MHIAYHVSNRSLLQWLDRYITTGNVKPADGHTENHLVLLEHHRFALNSTFTDDELCLEISDMFDVAYTKAQMGR